MQPRIPRGLASPRWASRAYSGSGVVRLALSHDSDAGSAVVPKGRNTEPSQFRSDLNRSPPAGGDALAHGSTVKARAWDNPTLFGGAKPSSRDRN